MPGALSFLRMSCLALPILLLSGCLREFRGRVVDAKTGEPKAGVRVEVYESGCHYYIKEQLDGGNFDDNASTCATPLVATSVTRADGSFSAHPMHRPEGVLLIATDASGAGKSEPVDAGSEEPVVLRYEAERNDSTLGQRLEERRKRKWRLH